MLTSFHLQNFKAWQDTGRIRLAPLTVLFGANSAGKSSLGHWLLALKQTAQSTDRRRALHLGDDRSLVDLGTYADCLHGHDLSRDLAFSLRWRESQGMEVADPLSDQVIRGDQLGLDVTLAANESGQPELRALRYRLFNGLTEALSAKLERKEGGKLELEATGYRLVRTVGKPWPLDAPEKFYRVGEASLARFQNGGFLSDFALALENTLSRIYFLGPLREAPRRIYQWSGDAPEDLGPRGEYAVAAILAAEAQGRRLNFGPRKPSKSFSEVVAIALKNLGIISSFEVKPLAAGRKEYEVLVRSRGDASEVKLTDVGFGVSQVLPAVVEAFYCPPHSVVWMEQPEIHLHPQVQANLADVFIDAIHAREKGENRDVQLIVESHSEHLLNRLQLRIAERRLKPEEVAIYFCSHGRKGARMERLEVNEDGEISNWPEDFFGDEMADIAGRALAAIEHRRGGEKA
jgi:predicted ATPase